MTNSTADELAVMLTVIEQESAKLETLKAESHALLKAVMAERKKLDNENLNLSAKVSFLVESEVGKAQTGLQNDLSASSQQVRGMVEKAKNTSLNTVLWAVAGSFVLGLVCSVAALLFITSDIKPYLSDVTSRILVIEKKLKIKN